MTDFIIALPAADSIWQNDSELPDYNPQPLPSNLMKKYNDGVAKEAYLVPDFDAADWPATTYIVGAWDRVTGLQGGQSYDDADPPNVIGTPTYPLQDDYLNYIRPLGNYTDPETGISGLATGWLDSMRGQGMPEQKFLQDDHRYPDGDAPFTMRVTREKITDDGFPHIPWGWRAEIISDDPLRDIAARAVGIYSDPAWQNYLFTTGAFALDAGTGLYTSVCPVGQRTAAPEPWYYSLLWGSLQEGNWQLTDEVEGALVNRLHWAGPQGASQDFYVSEQIGVQEQMVPQSEHYSPEGYQVVNVETINGRRIILELEGGAHDAADPHITIYLPDGIETIAFIWDGSRYKSGVEIGIRAKLLTLVGYKFRAELAWV